MFQHFLYVSRFEEDVLEQKIKERREKEETRLQGQMSQADEIQKTAEEWFSSMNKLEQKYIIFTQHHFQNYKTIQKLQIIKQSRMKFSF